MYTIYTNIHIHVTCHTKPVAIIHILYTPYIKCSYIYIVKTLSFVTLILLLYVTYTYLK